ncbi:class I SAM-dependent methyltransferase [Deefgea sp. CFH1-16]|uniref:class I SAM-dependent methyltransferase n=1 Tax=Deefgea sp. CFH1-16 TaxID=2675457 RepID=UPI0019403358
MDRETHWETVYQTKPTDGVSWYRPHLETSLRLIQSANIGFKAAIIDVGGGEATLVDDLLAQGYTRLSVLDISQAAIERTKHRLTEQATCINWLLGDITKIQLPAQQYDIWHDRAVFHFFNHRNAAFCLCQSATPSAKAQWALNYFNFWPARA